MISAARVSVGAIVCGLAMAAVASAQAPAGASSQEPVHSLDGLVGRVRIGQAIRVTDQRGRERRGRLERLSSDAIVLVGDSRVTLAASDVRRVRARDRDSLRNGTLFGLAVGAGLASAWCIGALADNSGDINAPVECGEGFTVFPAVGTLLGLATDAVIPGRMRVLYESPASRAGASAQLLVVPLVSARANGLAVRLAF